MKKHIFYSFLIFLFSFSILNLIRLFKIDEQDLLKYQNLSQRQMKTNFSKKEPVYQKRINVQKDIWYLENESRLHFSIFSTDSFLSLKNKNGHLEVVEDLKNIHCLAQEKIVFNPLTKKWEQKLKYFNAQKGTYLFPSHQFSSDMINLYFYDLEGIDLPKNLTAFSPYLKGVANQVFFTLSDKKSHFKAYHFKACFDTSQEIQ